MRIIFTYLEVRHARPNLPMPPSFRAHRPPSIVRRHPLSLDFLSFFSLFSFFSRFSLFLLDFISFSRFSLFSRFSIFSSIFSLFSIFALFHDFYLFSRFSLFFRFSLDVSRFSLFFSCFLSFLDFSMDVEPTSRSERCSDCERRASGLCSIRI